MYAKYRVQEIFAYIANQTSFGEALGSMEGFSWPPFLSSLVNYATGSWKH